MLFFRKEKYYQCYNLISLLTLDILPFDKYFSANSLSFVYIFSWDCFPFSYLLSGHFLYGWELLHLLRLCLNESPLIKLMCSWDLFWYQSVK